MFDDLLETWHAHCAINLSLLQNLPEGGLEAVGASGGMSVGQQLGHCHTVRVRWTEETAPDLVRSAVKFGREDAPTQAQLYQALEASGKAVSDLLKQQHQAGQGLKGFPGSLTSFVGYLIAHESHHHGQMVLALKHAGLPLEREQALGLWRGWWGREVAAL